MIEAIPSQARSPRTPRYGKPTQSNRQLLREVYSEGVSRGEEEVIKPDSFAEALRDTALAEAPKSRAGFHSGHERDSLQSMSAQSVLSAPRHDEVSDDEMGSTATGEAGEAAPGDPLPKPPNVPAEAAPDDRPPMPPNVLAVVEPGGDPPSLPSKEASDVANAVERRDPFAGPARRDPFATGNLSSFATAPRGLAAGTVSLIEPLRPDVLEWRQLETRRQASGRARSGARPASAPAARVRQAAVSTGKPPGNRGAAWRQRKSVSSYDPGSIPAVRHRDWDCEMEAVRRLVPGAPHQRPGSAVSRSIRPDSSNTESGASRRPESAPHHRPGTEISTSKRPDSSNTESTASRRPASAMSKRPQSSKLSESSISNRPLSAPSNRPLSGLSNMTSESQMLGQEAASSRPLSAPARRPSRGR